MKLLVTFLALTPIKLFPFSNLAFWIFVLPVEVGLVTFCFLVFSLSHLILKVRRVKGGEVK